MYDINDIQIFIMTHNRASFLEQSINSILNQTISVPELIVLDNESTDNTKDIVEKYTKNKVSYIKTFGFLGNFNKAREIVTKPYCILFHDDDIIHPQYLELALNVLNKNSNISLITTRYTEFLNDNVPEEFPILNTNYYKFETQKDFAEHMYFIEKIAYATAIYRTKDFLQLELEYEKYNKFNDWPLLVKMSALGKTILFNDKSLFFVRRHSGQDTVTSTNTPTIEQIINWDKLFFKAMNLHNKPWSLLNQAFNKRCYDYLFDKYSKYLSADDKIKYSFEDVLNLASQNNLYPTNKRLPFLARKYNKWLVKQLQKKHLQEDL